jgi:hypothetical protein
MLAWGSSNTIFFEAAVAGGIPIIKSIREGFQHSLRKDQSVLFRLRLKDLKDQFLLAHACSASHIEILCDLR